MTRFFVLKSQIEDKFVYLNGADQHHLCKVLRKKIGDEIGILDGQGSEYRARISRIESELVVAELLETIIRPAEPRVKLKLVQSLPKAEKFELVLQKNTELGVSCFQPILSERSNLKLDLKALAKKSERWQKIIKEAAEQSGRQIIPELLPVLNWEKLLTLPQTGLVLIPWEGERECSLRQVLEAQTELPEQVTVLIGPEGGFSLAEIDQAKVYGAIPVTLGPRILRTETAGLVVASCIFYHFFDFNY